jgi:hypothetical protein
MLKNGLLSTGEKYVVQIYIKRKKQLKNHINWLKNELTGVVQSLLLKVSVL